MKTLREEKVSECVRISVQEDGKEIARAYLYFLRNDFHEEPVGYIEHVSVDLEYRGGGIGTKLLNDIIVEARTRGCYKLIGTSRMERERVHALYTRLGFSEWGKEFRMDL